MIKHHKVEMIFSTASDIYQTMEQIATRASTSVETVLELLINNAILSHLENNSDWADKLTEEYLETYKPTDDYFDTIDTVSADDLDADEIDRLFETATRDMVFTGTGYIPESGMLVRVYEEAEN